MESSTGQLMEILEAGEVQRFHTCAGVDKQEVKSHSWGVAVIADYIMGAEGCDHEKVAVLRLAMYHDVSEQATGDIPAPVKWDYPEIQEILAHAEEAWERRVGLYLPKVDKRLEMILKVSDWLDGAFYCLSRMRDGRRGANRPFLKWMEALNRSKPQILEHLHTDEFERVLALCRKVEGRMEYLRDGGV